MDLPAIARIWRGRTRKPLVDEYLEYVYQEGVREILRKRGNLGAQLFRRIDGDVAEFTVISYWPSVAAMAAMRDDGDVRRVAHLARDSEYLLELPEFVEVVELHANEWR